MFPVNVNMVTRIFYFFLFMIVSIIIWMYLPVLERLMIDQPITVMHDDVSIQLTAYEHQLYKRMTKPTKDLKLIGHKPVVQEVESIANMFDKRPKESAILQPPNGILLFGPPGTGKTTIAKSLAGYMKCSFLHVQLESIEDKYYGEGIKNLSAVFSLSKKIKPCVIFFDEIDGFMSTRSSADQTHTNTMKTTLLTSLDTIQSEWDVIFVAATNRKSALDPALLRRLDIQLYMGNPTTEDQTEFFSKYVKLSKEEISPFISECPKWTLCDLKNFAKYCTRHYLIGKQLADDKMDVSVEELYAFREQYMQLKYSNDDTQSPFM